MIKGLHGRRYYIELTTKELEKVVCMIAESSLADEIFHTRPSARGNTVLYSEAKVESFRGKKYIDWRHITSSVYSLR